MSKSQTSDSESPQNSSSSEEEEQIESPKNGVGLKNKKLSNYENQRLKTIEENKARMKALGLKTMANSLMGSSQIVKKNYEKKGKRKSRYNEEDDEDYNPEDLSGSDDEGEKKKIKNKNPNLKKPAGQKPKKGTLKYKLLGEPDYVDDDDALMKAIALSLKGSAGFLKTQPSQSSVGVASDSNSLKNQNAQLQDSMGKRKGKKPFNSREQMTEDDVILHFFQFDEAGKDSISLRDIQRMAAAHDFPWSDKEMAHMIKYFDSDGDGKLNLEDFRKIAHRCNIVQTPEDSAS
ncbi:hypothetical protein Leryth_015492 [Lithospermum erythrorhizon]|nr:hypothetical protein Leryth_015492 [Lithospermum erythrorhizon]